MVIFDKDHKEHVGSIKSRRCDGRKQRPRSRHRYTIFLFIETRLSAITHDSQVRNLSLKYPSSPLDSGSFLIYLTARSTERGTAAVKALNSDPQLRAAKVLAEDGGATTIKFQILDINDAGSIHAFRDFLKKEHPEGIDVVINNAGISLDGFGEQTPFNLRQLIADVC